MSSRSVYSHKEWVIQYNDHAASMNDKAIWIPKEAIWMSESILIECKPQSILKLTTDQNPNWFNWSLIEVGV